MHGLGVECLLARQRRILQNHRNYDLYLSVFLQALDEAILQDELHANANDSDLAFSQMAKAIERLSSQTPSLWPCYFRLVKETNFQHFSTTHESQSNLQSFQQSI
jgi:hypothetical protein